MDSQIINNPVGEAPEIAKRRVVLVDDHPIVRDGLVQMISRQPDLEVCGEASSADEALGVVEKLAPDLVIVDIFLEGINGIELTKLLRERHSSLPILILSMHDEGLYAERAIRAGAMGYVMKQEASRTILEAIRTVLVGEVYLSDGIKEILSDHGSEYNDDNLGNAVERLSSREMDVFVLIGRGKKRNEIAKELDISIKTVETHRANIKYKLNCRSASDLVQSAQHWARINPEGDR